MTHQVYLGLEQGTLEQKNAFWTAREISQQPSVWQQLLAQMVQEQGELQDWLKPVLALPNLRIILTGAGTSAYIGEALQAHLNARMTLSAGQRVEAISTTNILSNPGLQLRKDVPTLLVSYGRSGNSPESRAAVELADQLVEDCWHLVVSCNPEGALVTSAKDNPRYKVLLMPSAAHDQSFAMTSSFTSMMLATLTLFTPDQAQYDKMRLLAEQILLRDLDSIETLAALPCRRLVFLGSGPLLAIAREAALKVLELTAGGLPSFYESPLGFRHGPKSLIDNSTQVLLLPSANSYTGRYDADLRLELQKDAQALHISAPVALSQIAGLEDVWLGFPYILYCQMLGFFKALQFGISPDNPCPTGEVNRVVQGVNIYPYRQD
ncbi:SIS domain-containing protein [Bowmanella denitrificans]|uniref:SIS domain-containing protein n=1 Tax=Bowmanella denitrificans TaxID=366582 RepID=UPI000C99A9F9|nr:SIS domain-containing protein [Bowmanella denitrificans]